MLKKLVIIVLAGNYRQYLDFINQESKNGPTYFIFGDSPEKMAGFRAFDIKVIGTFWGREDAGKLHEFAKSRLN